MEEFVKSLNLPFEGEMEKDEYVIRLDTSDDFSKAFSYLSNDTELEQDDMTMTTPDNAAYTFYDDWYEVKLYADFLNDSYRIVIGER